MADLAAFEAAAAHFQLLGVDFLPAPTTLALALCRGALSIEATSLLLVLDGLPDLLVGGKSREDILFIHDLAEISFLDIDVVFCIWSVILEPVHFGIVKEANLFILRSVHKVGRLALLLHNLVQLSQRLDG